MRRIRSVLTRKVLKYVKLRVFVVTEGGVCVSRSQQLTGVFTAVRGWVAVVFVRFFDEQSRADPAQYRKFFLEFGHFLKEGVCSDQQFQVRVVLDRVLCARVHASQLLLCAIALKNVQFHVERHCQAAAVRIVDAARWRADVVGRVHFAVEDGPGQDLLPRRSPPVRPRVLGLPSVCPLLCFELSQGGEVLRDIIVLCRVTVGFGRKLAESSPYMEAFKRGGDAADETEVGVFPPDVTRSQ